MHFHIVTDFPDAFTSYLSTSIVGRAKEKGHIQITFHKISDFSDKPQNRIDDAPYGGGAGNVLCVEPLDACICSIEDAYGAMPKYHFHPRGTFLNQSIVEKKSQTDTQCLLLCGHYEGIDERLFSLHTFEHICIGEYVLSGGELAALVYIDAVSRHIPGVLGNPESLIEESFSAALDGNIEYPHYSRPQEYKGLSVPDDLTSGDHKKIALWRKKHVSSHYLDNDSLDA